MAPRFFVAAGFAIALASCAGEDADSDNSREAAVEMNGAENVAAPAPAPVEPDAAVPSPDEPPSPSANTGIVSAESDEPEPATEDEYIHRNKADPRAR